MRLDTNTKAYEDFVATYTDVIKSLYNDYKVNSSNLGILGKITTFFTLKKAVKALNVNVKEYGYAFSVNRFGDVFVDVIQTTDEKAIAAEAAAEFRRLRREKEVGTLSEHIISTDADKVRSMFNATGLRVDPKANGVLMTPKDSMHRYGV